MTISEILFLICIVIPGCFAVNAFFIYLFDKDEWELTKRFFGGGWRDCTWRDWLR